MFLLRPVSFYIMPLLAINNRWKKITTYALIGSVLGVSQLSSVLYWFAFLGVFLFLVCLSKESKWQSAVLGSFIVFTVQFAWSISWFYSVYPISWLPVEISKFQLSLITIYWLTSSVWLGLGGVLFGLGFWYLNKNYKDSLLLAPALPLLWVATEISASFIFSIFTIGAHIAPNTNFSFGYIGYILANNSITLQFAYLGGVYVMSFVVIFVTTLLWLFLNIDKTKTKNMIGLAMFDCCWVVALILVFVFKPDMEVTEREYSVAVIETDFAGDVFKREGGVGYREEALKEALVEATAFSPTHILLPEDARLNDPNFSPEQAMIYMKFAYSYDGVLVDSGRKPVDDFSILRATIFDGENSAYYQVDKQYLVPQGEFMPYLYMGVVRQFLSDEVASSISSQFSYKPGPLVSLSEAPAHIPAILFCFESVSPTGVKKITQERNAPFIAHPISHAWFNKPDIFWYQLDNMLKVQAVWNQVDIVSVANKSQSKVYRASGQIEIPESIKSGEGWKIYQVNI